MSIKLVSVGLLSAALLFSSCKKDETEETSELSIGTSYSGDFTTTIPSTLGAAGNLESLVTTMKLGQTENVTAVQMTALYRGSDTSLEDMSCTQYESWVAELFTSTESASASSVAGNEIDFDNISNTPNGGSAGKRLFDGSPIEPVQLVEKAAFGGVNFYYVKNHLFADPASVSQTDLDNALALFGATPAFDDLRFSAKYADKRALNDATYLDQIYYQFRKAQSAIDQGFTTDKVDAIEAITRYWEEALMTQAIHYLYAASASLSDASLSYDDDGYIGAIHSWSEAVAFVKGFYKVSGTTITDTQIESILIKINAPISGSYDVLSLVNNKTELDDLALAIAEIGLVYAISPSTHQ